MDLKLAGIHFQERALTSGEISQFQVRTHEVGAFRLTESKFASGYRLGKHSHEYACFFIVLKGAVTEFYGKKSRECRQLSMAIKGRIYMLANLHNLLKERRSPHGPPLTTTRGRPPSARAAELSSKQVTEPVAVAAGSCAQ